ncbi:cytochrome P450 4C1-like, partial [Frankliniella occidentalis]|uniref:Cytochrome P450 4C1-like n=1 Tax=Frankliniella occidentalis TaxID=133901 RepID=A0A6J1TAY2_FRAOC
RASRRAGTYEVLTELCSRYAASPAFRVCVGHATTVFLLRPDDIGAVLSSTRFATKSSLYSALEPLIGSGLAILAGEDYRRHRKAVTPSLHLDVLKEFAPVFYKHGQVLADSLAARDGSVLDVVSLCGDCANAAICETVMTTDVADDDLGRQGFLAAIPEANKHFMFRLSRPWFLGEWAFKLSGRYAAYLDTKRALDDFTERIIREKKSRLVAASTGTPPCAAPSTTRPPGGRLAFLDHVLCSAEGAALGDDELAAEVKTLVAIASGSSMDTLSLFLQTIAIRQDIQEAIWKEVTDVVGEDASRALSAADLQRLQYTERVFKEVLRFYSVVPLFARRSPEDVRLPSGVLVPRGCHVALWLPHVHRCAEHFQDPDEFDPDRFLPERARGRHPYAFLAFSAGPRSCVGQRYALHFLKAVAAALVLRLRFAVPAGGPSRPQDVPLLLNLTTCVRGGAKVLVRVRPPRPPPPGLPPRPTTPREGQGVH